LLFNHSIGLLNASIFDNFEVVSEIRTTIVVSVVTIRQIVTNLRKGVKPKGLVLMKLILVKYWMISDNHSVKDFDIVYCYYANSNP